MKAAVWYGKKDIRVEERELGEMGPNDLKIRVAWTGICGSDLHEYLHGPVTLPKDTTDITLGHEFSGVVDDIGTNVSNLKVGDRVALNPMYIPEVKNPETDQFRALTTGFQFDGAYADYIIMPESTAVKIPDYLSLDAAAAAEPAAVGMQAVLDAGLKIGDNIVVFGTGPIGLGTIMAAKAAGATNIVAVDLFDERLELALKVGATHTINSNNENPVEKIRELYPDGVDIAFEVAGIEVTFKQAFEVLKTRGMLNVVAVHTKDIQLNLLSVLMQGITIKASLGYTQETFKRAISLAAEGQLPTEQSITKKIELDDIVEEGFEVLISDKSQAKILVKLSGAE